MDDIFQAVRRACTAAIWSRGVELARGGSVTAESGADDEVVVRVTTRAGLTSPRVSLFLDDGEWDCSCPGRLDACEHVAAAVIALKRAEDEGDGLPGPQQPAARLVYRLERGRDGLSLRRVLRQDGEDTPLEASLASLRRTHPGLRLVASQADLAVELQLGVRGVARLPPAGMPRLFKLLARCSRVELDGEPITVSADPVLPVAVLEDQGNGFRLQLVDDPSVEQVFANGAALAAGVLRPVGESRLTGRERHELRGGRYYPADSAAELVTEVLPSLERRIPVDIRTERLPSAVRETPQIHLEVAAAADQLQVQAWVVYGDPPRARIQAGELRHESGPVPIRDPRAEQRLERRVRRELGVDPGVRITFVGEEAVEFADRLSAWEGNVPGDAHERFRRMPPLEAELSLSDDDFDLRFVSPGAGGSKPGRADPAAVVAAWRRGESLVPLLGGGWAPLPADWLRRFGDRVADLLAARELSGSLPAALLPDLARLAEDLDRPPPPAFERLRGLVRGFDGIPTAPLPADLGATLRVYQQRGLDWLAFMRGAGLGALLADDMGLGKTLQALCAVPDDTLVVAPTSVLSNWQDEIRRFRPGLTCCVYHGPTRRLEPASITLTTYALLRLDREALCSRRWGGVVLDEAQAIKNPDSQVARAAYALKAPFRVALTGTPVENRLDELWSQFHFINPGLLGGRSDFDERYARPIADGEPGAAARLRERIAPFVLRRLKSEVAPELPPRTDVVLHCELDETERDTYDAIRAATLSEVVAKLGQGGGVMAALESLLRLRQACCHVGLLPGTEAARSSKVDLLLESLDTVVAEGHRALVFSQWTGLLDRVQPALAEAGFEHVRLDGSTRDRGKVVRRFQRDGGPPVMLISLKAGGTGLNLTAADHVFILDPWWNPAVEDQAADRAHRIGQDKPVMIYRLVAENTVEERILDLQRRKREIALAALDGADRAASINREDLLELLR